MLTTNTQEKTSCTSTGCCPTSPGVCMPGLAYEHHKRSDEVAQRYPAPCSPGHRRQHPVRRRMLYAELISAGWSTS